MNFCQYESDSVFNSIESAVEAVSSALTGCELQMYNRILHSEVTHTCKVLRFEYAGLNQRPADVTNALSGGWREVDSILKDGGKLSCKVYIPDTPTGKTLRGVLVAAMLDQSVERFNIVFRDGGGFTFSGFVFVARDIRLSATVTIVDIEVTGELSVFEGSL